MRDREKEGEKKQERKSQICCVIYLSEAGKKGGREARASKRRTKAPLEGEKRRKGAWEGGIKFVTTTPDTTPTTRAKTTCITNWEGRERKKK